MKKIVIAIDSLKGCLTSSQAAESARTAVQELFPEALIVAPTVADGGEGMQEALTAATGGRTVTTLTYNPTMQPLWAQYGLSGDGKTAFIETASASGLTLVPACRRSPLHTTTYGTGLQIRHALESGCRHFILGLGGSATNDAGLGLMQALGCRFYLANGVEITEPIGGRHLIRIARIDTTSMPAVLSKARFTAACDVQAPFCGPEGAAHVFAPQKGASPQEVALLDDGLHHIAHLLTNTTGYDITYTPGSGAAGGMGGTLTALLGATLMPGSRLILEALRFEELIQGADLIITGEGKADRQTLMGKLPGSILNIARRHHIPTLLIAGRIENADLLTQAGFTRMAAITPSGQPLQEAMHPDVARRNIRHTLHRLLSYS